MKKFIALILVTVTLLCGCSNGRHENKVEGLKHMINIEYQENEFGLYLVYDQETKIVYYEYRGLYKYSLCPYYSTNGYLCRYNTETGEIEEIIH